MNRQEFSKKLRSELSRLPQEEREAAIEYYEEYFDEAGVENEQEVLKQLGSPKQVAAQIKSEYAVRIFDEEEKHSVKDGLSAIGYVILGICSAPIAIPLALLLGLLALAGCLIALAVVLAAFACVIAGMIVALACLIAGCMSLGTSLPAALMLIGFGLAAVAFLAALGALLVIAARAAVRATVSAARKHNERRRIRKMLRESGDRDKSAAHTEYTESTENAENAGNAENVENTENTEDTENMENTESTEKGGE